MKDGTSLLRRHKVAGTLVCLVAVLLLAVLGAGLYLTNLVGSIPRIDVDLEESTRPPAPSGTAAGSVNILIAGTDNGEGGSIRETVSSGRWQAGQFRSDAIMILHITAERERAYVISIPRDSWVRVDGLGMAKVNAALSHGGPALFVQTIESLTNVRMDHVIIVDWEGFREISSTLGGIPVTIPQGAGSQERVSVTLEGDEALAYVRQRYGLARGDLSRIQRQQNFLRATAAQVMSPQTRKQPLTLVETIRALSKHLVLDEGLSNRRLVDLALSTRDITPERITYFTIPVTCCKTVQGQSTVTIQLRRTRALFGALLEGTLEEYLGSHPVDVLPQVVD